MVKKYKDSFETQSESLAAGGRSIFTVVENEDTHTSIDKAPPPEFDAPRHKGNISPVRTLATDMQSATDTNKVSLASEALRVPQKERPEKDKDWAGAERTHPASSAQGQRSRQEPQIKRSRLPSYVVILVLLFIIFGGSVYLFTSRQGISLGSLSFSMPKLQLSFGSGSDTTVIPDEPTERALINSDSHTNISLLSNESRATLTEKISDILAGSKGVTTISINEMRAPQDNEEFSGGQIVTADASRLFSILQASVSGALAMSITDYNLGIATGYNGENEVFLVAKIRNYDDAFGSLFDWEQNMPSDLFGIFHNRASSIFSENTFSDATVSGLDARELVIASGDTENETAEPILVYAFPDHNTLILTRSREALVEVANKLPQQ